MENMHFYEYVAEMLLNAGHIVTSDPIYVNHTAEEALYIDSSKDVPVSRFDRSLLGQIENVSLIADIKWPGVVEDLDESVQIFSITVEFSARNRSQYVADIHHLLHQYWNCTHSIVFFKNDNYCVISFADKDQSHILSDWFSIEFDLDVVSERLNIADISIETSEDYFLDFLYAIARDYYIHPISFEDASYGMLPIDYIERSLSANDGVIKEDIKAVIRQNLSANEIAYGDDYVDPVYAGMDDYAKYREFAEELDRISFDLELEEGTEDTLFEPSDFDDEVYDDEDDMFDDLDDDIDPAIFDDPVLMVKWLEQREKKKAASSMGQDYDDEVERIAAEKLEAERREKAHLEAERLEAERVAAEKLEAERREKARLEAERLERERLEAERQLLYTSIIDRHANNLRTIETNYSTVDKRLSDEILLLQKEMSDLNTRLSRLSILQFGEKRSIKAQVDLLEKKKLELHNQMELEKLRYYDLIKKENTRYALELAQHGFSESNE